MKKKIIIISLISSICLLIAYFYLNSNGNPLPPSAQADEIIIDKSKRTLTLLEKGEIVKTYKVSLGREPIGKKEREGDMKTPEGIYMIVSRKSNSGYHLSLRISYPNAADKANAQTLGVSPGRDIMIHGIRNGFGWLGKTHLSLDWTQGCIAVTNPEIEEIWRVVPNGTPVEIIP